MTITSTAFAQKVRNNLRKANLRAVADDISLEEANRAIQKDEGRVDCVMWAITAGCWLCLAMFFMAGKATNT